MKIIHLIYSLSTGGSETMLVDIVNEQIKHANVSIVVINNIYNQFLLSKIDDHVKVYFINRIPNSKNPYSLLKLNALLFRLNADILHCHNHKIAPILLNHFRNKSVLTLHCMGIPVKHLTKYNKLFSISESVKKDILERTRIDSQIIYNGIQTNLIKIKIKQSINNIFKIVIIGRLSHLIKGQDIAIKAIHNLKDMGIKNIRLDLIGEGDSEEFLKKLTLKYGLTDQVNFLGLKDRNYIYNHLKDYDLLIQPSIYEGFGLTVAEGMATKVPVLVSNIDGPMEIIKSGKYGYYFKSGDAVDLAKQIHYIMENYTNERSIQLVENAYNNVIHNYNINKTAIEYLISYNK